jgi:hypothetical protein
MKFSVASEHRHYFQKHLSIEFEGLLTQEQLSTLQTACESTLSARLDTRPSRLKDKTADQIFSAGRDLWRSDDQIKKAVTQRILAEIASELIERKPLRLGYDQFFPFPTQIQKLVSIESPFADFLQQQPTIKEISCINGILCGIVLCLSGAKGKEILDVAPMNESQSLLIPPVNIFPKIAGHGVFFHPDARIDLNQLLERPGQDYLMIIYTQARAQYTLQESDLNTHTLKRLGYVFGDRLSDKLNPVVYR